MRIGSLFAGVGGFDLAAERVWGKGSTVWHSEIDPYACAVFAQHFPQSRNVGDVTTWEPDCERDAVDLLCGGFPCQPTSTAGKRLAQADPRWLWPHVQRVAGILRPRLITLENTPGLLTAGMGDVLGDLAALGYDAEWESLPASAFGAPHQRDRVFLVAYPESDGRAETLSVFQRLCPPPRFNAWPRTPLDTRADLLAWLGGFSDGQSPLLRSHDGIFRPVDRLTCLGNAVVPQVAEWIFRQIQATEVSP